MASARYKVIISALFFLLLFSSDVISYAMPQRIVSLAPSVTESIYALGAEDMLVGVTSFCDRPPQAKGKRIVGTILDPNIEVIVSLGPDIVFTIDELNRAQDVAALRNMGLNVEILEPGRDFDDVMAQFMRIGALIGRGKEAEAMIAETKEEIASTKTAIEPQEKPSVFWQVSGRPVITVGAESFQNDLIAHAGGSNIFGGVDNAYFRVSREDVIMKNPDIIILAIHGGESDSETLEWEKYTGLAAVKSHRIYTVDVDTVCRPTPRGIIDGLMILRGVIRPGINPEAPR